MAENNLDNRFAKIAQGAREVRATWEAEVIAALKEALAEAEGRPTMVVIRWDGQRAWHLHKAAPPFRRVAAPHAPTRPPP